ncbi:MAG: PIN domain-containing protein [Candidatus Micrarchaeota archaeon]
MQTLVVDANFLMSAYRFKVDAIDELGRLVAGSFRLVTSTSIILELERISEKKGVAGPQARYALSMIRKRGIRIMRTSKEADYWIEEYCSGTGAIACTNDAALRKRLKKNGIKTIALRGKSRLDYV